MLLIFCVGLQFCEAESGVVGAKHPGEINPLSKCGLVMVLGDGALVPDVWARKIARIVLGDVQDIVGGCNTTRKVQFSTRLHVFLVVLVSWSSGRTPGHIGKTDHAH